MQPGWVRSLRDQCDAVGVPFLFKQWGEWAPDGWVHAGTPFDDRHATFNGRGEIVTSRDGLTPTHNFTMVRAGKKAAGRLLDGAEHNGIPTSPALRLAAVE